LSRTSRQCDSQPHHRPIDAIVSLREADLARTDFAVIESEIEVIQKQLARLATRRELPGTAFGIIFTTMMPTTLNLLFFLRLVGLCA
jgi:hypothetical protein